MKFLFSLLLFPTLALANEPQEELVQVMDTYLRGLKNQDSKLLNTVCSKKLMLKMNRNLKHSFAQQIPSKKYKRKNFDLMYEVGARDKNLFFVGIKDKSQKSYNEQRYIIKKIDQSYIIDDITTFD